MGLIGEVATGPPDSSDEPPVQQRPTEGARMEKRNLAARAGHWSATHRKTAIFGWLGFVVLAFMIGNAVKQQTIHGADQFSGEAGRAEHVLHHSGLRPNDENVLVQSDTLTIRDLRFRSAVTQASSELSRAQYVENVVSPIGGD